MEAETSRAVPRRLLPNSTLFSSKEYTHALCRALGEDFHPLAIPVRESGRPRTMFATRKLDRLGLWYLCLAAHGFYASPGWEADLKLSTLKGIIRRLSSFRVFGFEWNVRFDHQALAAGLIALGLVPHRNRTQVLYLNPDYDKVFGGYHATMRNHVRRGRRSCRVRDAQGMQDIQAYFAIHRRLTQLKGDYGFCTPDLMENLLQLEGVGRLVLAECEGQIAAGGMFLRDGCSVMYFHGAADRAFSKYYPACAVFDEAIRWGCEAGAASFNFGGSAGIPSLERFKSFWGAVPEQTWVFTWTNPCWKFVSRMKSALLAVPFSLFRRPGWRNHHAT
jgi:hypothetical protein